jgi:polysaccharide pyruvyl transferase WcaK-like protein
MKEILLLGATFETENMGVGALTAGALYALTRDPMVRVKLLDYSTDPVISVLRIAGHTVEVPLINLRFSWKALLPNNVALLLLLAAALRLLPTACRKWILGRNRWLASVHDAEAAAALSGGDSFSDIYGVGRFFYVWLPQLLVILMGKELTLLPQTIGPFRGALSRVLARYVMRRAKVIYSRDMEGLKLARAMLGLDDNDPKVQFCHDLGFLCEPHSPTRLDLGTGHAALPANRPLVGLNVSGLLLMGGYGRDNSFRLKLDYRDLVQRIVRLFIEDKDCNVLLVPHVFGAAGESDSAAIESIHTQLAGRYGERLLRVRGRYDQGEIKHIIGHCDFFVGARMHACIAALSQTVPAVAIAYSGKFTGVLQTIGVQRLVADPRSMTLERTLQLIDQAFDDRRRLREDLEAAMPGVRAAILEIAARMGSLSPAQTAAA